MDDVQAAVEAEEVVQECQDRLTPSPSHVPPRRYHTPPHCTPSPSPPLREHSHTTCGRSLTDLAEQRGRRERETKELLLNDLSPLDPQERIAVLLSKYASVYEERRIAHLMLVLVQRSHEEAVRKSETVTAELEQSQQQLEKEVKARCKLEELCRELQLQKKKIQLDGVSKLQQSETERLKLSEKFKTSLAQLSTAIDKGSSHSNKLHDENASLVSKLTDLANTSEEREKQVKVAIEDRDSCISLLQERVDQLELQNTQEANEHLKEKEKFLQQLCAKDKEILEHLENEKNLSDQVTDFMGKYVEFQSSVKANSEALNTFKTKIAETQSVVEEQTTRVHHWKSLYEDASTKLEEALSSAALYRLQNEQLNSKNGRLEQLCRALQNGKSDKPTTPVKTTARKKEKGSK